MRKRSVILMVLLLGCFLVSSPEGKEQPTGPGELYDSAMELYYQGKYTRAIEIFSGLIQSFPTSPSVSHAHYMIGKCYLQLGQFEQARQRFIHYRETYPNGDRVSDAERGISLAQERSKEDASLQFHRFTPPPSRVSKEVKRRICVQVFSFDAERWEDIEKRVKELKKAGIDTVIVRVFQNRGDRVHSCVTPQQETGVYFRTGHAPVVDDLLGKLTEMVHRHGLEIFAWMTTQDADYGLDGHQDLRTVRYNFETKKMETGRGISLFHPVVLNRLEGLFRDLGRYAIDGILFQDDLVLKHNEDFHPEAGKAFFKEFGYAPGSLPVTESVSRNILSLPMYAGITAAQVEKVTSLIHSYTHEMLVAH